MNVSEMIKAVQNFFHSMVSDMKPALDFVETVGGRDVLILAEGVLAGLAAGTPWAAITTALVAAAETQGIQLAEGAASIVLNLAKANLDAKALTPQVTTPAASDPVAA